MSSAGNCYGGEASKSEGRIETFPFVHQIRSLYGEGAAFVGSIKLDMYCTS